MRIYADNAATTKISDSALRAMVECAQKYIGNPSSLHTSGQLAAEELYKIARRAVRTGGESPLTNGDAH